MHQVPVDHHGRNDLTTPGLLNKQGTITIAMYQSTQFY